MTTQIEVLIPVDEAYYFPDDFTEAIFNEANAKLASFGWRGLEARQQVVAVLRALVERAVVPVGYCVCASDFTDGTTTCEQCGLTRT